MMNKCNSWTCINFERNVPEGVACDFCHKLAQMCQISGTVFLLAKFLHEFALEPILPPLRARLNKVERALKFQCCLTKHVFRMSKQYLANVARKINVKVGGSNTVLMDALSKRIPLVRHTIIIFGADVTHPHPGEDSSPSIAAVVASQDWPEVTKYAWLLLISFEIATGQNPQRIIFCRYTIQKFTCILGWSKRRAILSSVAFMSLIKKLCEMCHIYWYLCFPTSDFSLCNGNGFIAELILWFFEQCRLHIMLIWLLSVPSFTWNLRHQTVVLWQVDQLGVEFLPEDQAVQGLLVVQPLNLFGH
ncbi:unnamed protein product [Musa acuminata subsp. burmannicoides]